MRHRNIVTSKRKNKDNVYIVESILDECVVKNQTVFKVRWQGFPPEEESWEPESNLSNVRDLIDEFRSRQKSKPLVGCQASATSTTKQTEESPSASQRRRMTKSRVGHFEYVPQNELVASKTKYFDDIRDGKIDLSSNDLYSRVKTRRRCVADTPGNFIHEEDSLSRPSSLTELNDFRYNFQSSPSRYSAPSSPKNSSQFIDTSFDDGVSALSDPTENHQPAPDSSCNPKEIKDEAKQLVENTKTGSRINVSSISRRRHIKRSRLSLRLRRNKLRYLKMVSNQKKAVFAQEKVKEEHEPVDNGGIAEVVCSDEAVLVHSPQEDSTADPLPSPAKEIDAVEMVRFEAHICASLSRQKHVLLFCFRSLQQTGALQQMVQYKPDRRLSPQLNCYRFM